MSCPFKLATGIKIVTFNPADTSLFAVFFLVRLLIVNEKYGL